MIKQIIPQQVCLGCKGCCRFSQTGSVWSPCLLFEEIENLKQNNIPASSISPENKIHLKPQRDGASFLCQFLRAQDNKCNIYSLRPFECQLYPFLISRVQEAVFLAVDLNCPFAKDNFESGIFKKHIQYLERLLKSTRWLNILRRNPHIIQAYSGVTNLAEIKL